MNIHEREWQGKFSEREKLWLLAYGAGQDSRTAAQTAGYAPGALDIIGDKILKREDARAELKLIRSELAVSDVADVSIEEIVEGFRVIAMANVKDFLDFKGDVMDVTEMDPIKAKAIKEIKRTVNPRNGHVTTVITMHDKVKALENLGRIGGHYAADNGQSGGDVNIQINLPGGIGGL